jgi:Fic family protein
MEFQAGKYIKQDGYKSFSPSFINRPYRWKDRKIDVLLEKATRYLGELNAYSTLAPDIDFFIHMHVTKEATSSSSIEGTLTTLDEAVLPEKDVLPERRDDWAEVGRYTDAMNHAIEEHNSLPLSMRLIKNAHKLLLQGARGKDKKPGEIRTSQNWIGGSSPTDAFFVPPHHNELPELLSDLEKFWHNDNLDIPDLIKNAISHYQFETIHPFLDGNGRVGRMLITLYLVEKGILSKPTLYLSDFFQQNKGAYYDSLTVVRASSNLDQWIKFFLVGVAETAKTAKMNLQKIVDLKQDCDTKIATLGRRAKIAQELLEFLYKTPAVDARFAAKNLNVTYPTANKLLKEMVRINIFEEDSVIRLGRTNLYIFTKYTKLFKSLQD